ncbi:septum site-determining protein MinC [Methylobacterium gnaphalii]|uniref:Probable septum site-determining protein MinC n=1 Tax=Methylobacterium gnaphalii TaxID=1010610 RepID=A0A512JP43_9HYPH|nr:septum site-determining protein MinC [Methylobacterium gnaphalii]GEP11709.1 putative septum site-determining protein MinC [Methylobacterium gnaphalii]GJD68777.1 septum site-determining protein MinC [Methylobacterium gnaphalii]GLS50206.1 putative septum site-determining protein MinC [Methylobacterium gnaphalii]
MPALNGLVGKEKFTPVTSPAPTLPIFACRGRVFRALALAPQAPVSGWLALLDEALKRSPTLFDGKGVILDAAGLGSETSELASLIAELLSRRIRILGIEGAACDSAGLPPFLINGRPAPDSVEVVIEEEKPPMTSLTIEGSVRSGQTIIHREGDVTVMGSISSGAEILAGGSVHVYGALRGRVIAGAAKNPRARIYCRKFEPELLGIDRLVRTAEDMGNHLRGQAAQIWLDGGAIKIAPLI